MTRYLLRWQLVFLKRYLLSVQGLIPLGMNIVFQIVLLASIFVSQQDFVDNLTMVFVYTSAFAISQTTTIYSQALQVSSSGLLGIAPIPPRPRVAMAMFEMLVTAMIQAFVISLGLGIGIMERVSVLGGLLIWLLSFFATLCLYAGVAAGLIAFMTMVLPPKYRKIAAALTGLLYFLSVILYILGKQKFPGVIKGFADIFINTAIHGFGAGGESVWFFGTMIVGFVLGLLPMAKAYGKILTQSPPSPNVDSKTYESRTVPEGITQIFLWRERIALSRNRVLLFVLVIGVIAVMFIPSRFNTFIFIYLGVQIGALILSVGPQKSLALIYASPILPSKLWKSRLIALMPITSIATLVFLMAGIVHAGGITVGTALCDILLPYTGLLGISYAVILNPSMFTRTGKQKQSVLRVLISTILFSFGPLMLGFLDISRPWVGVVINAGIIFGLLFFGTTVLDTKKSVRYLFQ